MKQKATINNFTKVKKLFTIDWFQTICLKPTNFYLVAIFIFGLYKIVNCGFQCQFREVCIKSNI